MKLTLFLCSLDFSSGMSLLEAVDYAASQGFSAVEPFPTAELAEPNLEFAQKFGDYCKEKGLEIPCFSMMADLGHEDSSEEIKRVCSYVDVAEKMGAKAIHHTLSPYIRKAHLDYTKVKNTLLKNAEKIAYYALNKGIQCYYEPQGFTVNGCENYIDFINSAEWQNKGVLIDFGNVLFMDENPLQLVAKLGSSCKHVHIKDYLLKSGSSQYPGEGWHRTICGNFLRGTVVGHGQVDLINVFKILLMAGYDGNYSLEFDGFERNHYAITEGIKNLNRYYNEAKVQLKI